MGNPIAFVMSNFGVLGDYCETYMDLLNGFKRMQTIIEEGDEQSVRALLDELSKKSESGDLTYMLDDTAPPPPGIVGGAPPGQGHCRRTIELCAYGR